MSAAPSPSDPPRPHHRCPACGGPNACTPAAAGRFDVACWCTAVTVRPEALAALPAAAQVVACLCRACATGEAPAPSSPCDAGAR